jgi:2-oxoisovalerate ferredoxin oxidoreductase beta subunit
LWSRSKPSTTSEECVMYEVALKRPRSFYAQYDRKPGDKALTHYCPGCGHGIVHKYVAEALDDLGLQDRTIFISPVGCSVFGYYYFDVGHIQSAHGRAPAVATGVKRANPRSIVIGYQGDGDLAAIGLNEIIQAANRGEQITIFFINNAIYGMTGGQMAPTTLVGQKTTTSPRGRNPANEGFPLKVAELISQVEAATYVERVALIDAKHNAKTRRAIRKALSIQAENKGFTLVEIVSPCPTGWKMKPTDSLNWMRENMLPYFHLGVYRDVSSEIEPRPYPHEPPSLDEIPRLLDITERPVADVTERPVVADAYRNPRIKISGFGGQGVLLLGVAMAQAGMTDGYHVSWLPSYGPEMRGGTAHCHVNISEEAIGSPLVDHPTVLVAMNRPSLEKFEPQMAPGGLLLYNTSLINIEPSRDDIEKVPIPATEMASRLGNVGFTNMVFLGAYLGKTGLIPVEIARVALDQVVKRKNLMPGNLKAIQEGMEYVKKSAG